MTQPSSKPAREVRVPLHVPVSTTPALADCWAVNLSPSGIGLVAARGETTLSEGDELGLELTLPDGQLRIRTQGEVRWLYELPGALDGRLTLALGVQFAALAGDERLAIARYFHAYRPHVAAVVTGEALRRQLQRAISEHANLHFVHDAPGLRELLGRGDIAAVLVTGEARADRLALVRELSPAVPLASPLVAWVTGDLMPRVVWAGDAPPSELVDLFGSGALHATVPDPSDDERVRTAVLRACAEHGARTEAHRNALALERALQRTRSPSPRSRSATSDPRQRLIGSSAELAEVIRQIEVVAPHKVAVLLQGETGTGKEELARLVHALSDRARAPLVTQDCGTLAETLLESELFGHVRGAFTGALAAHPGLFVMADGGSVVLDEIENTSPGLQAKLLRVIETGEIRPVGGTSVQRVDVRLIATSNRDLGEEVREGRFRADLYYRLASFPIAVPPLRARPSDVVELAHHFLDAAQATLGKRVGPLTKRTRALLERHTWPGNVRELRNAIDRAVLLTAPGAPIEPHAFALPSATPMSSGRPPSARGATTLRARLDAAEREILADALARNGGVLRRAARELEASPATLWRRARRLGLTAEGAEDE